MQKNTLWQRHIALPQDHGSWVFLFSPLLIGLFAGGVVNTGMMGLILGALSAFLMRQPITMWIKVMSGRRAWHDLSAARFWAGVYAVLGLASLVLLWRAGLGFLLWLVLPALPVFVWHLWLVSRRAERRQVGVEVVGSGVLALAAPAALAAAQGGFSTQGWLLWLLVWLQSAASIVYAYLRLEQRALKQVPPRAVQWQMARRALLYTGFNVVAVTLLAVGGALPWGVLIPYLIQFGEAIWGTIHPAVGVKPTHIGIRQLLVSSLFTLLFIWFWR